MSARGACARQLAFRRRAPVDARSLRAAGPPALSPLPPNHSAGPATPVLHTLSAFRTSYAAFLSVIPYSFHIGTFDNMYSTSALMLARMSPVLFSAFQPMALDRSALQRELAPWLSDLRSQLDNASVL